MLIFLVAFGCSNANDSKDASETRQPGSTDTPSDTNSLVRYKFGTRSSTVEIVNFDDDDDDDTDLHTDVDDDPYPDDTSTRYVSFEELITEGAETGVWGWAEGTTTVLQILTGELPAETIDVWDDVIHHSFTEVTQLGFELLDSNNISQAEKDELRRLLNIVLPPVHKLFPSEFNVDEGSESANVSHQDHLEEAGSLRGRAALDGDSPREMASQLKAVSSSNGLHEADGPDGYLTVNTGRLVRVSDEDCVKPALNMFDDVDPQTKVDCWQVISRDVNSVELKVIFPSPLRSLAESALDVMQETVETTTDWGGENMDSVLLITEARNPGLLGVAINRDRDLMGEQCMISMFTGEFYATKHNLERQFDQVVAHEQLHCQQFASFGTEHINAENNWIVEAMAEMFSHLIVPDGGVERKLMGDFMKRSVHTALDQMSYEVWVWWMFLVNEHSPKHVWNLQAELLPQGLNALRKDPEIAERFQRFTIDLITVGVPTYSRPVPASSHGINLPEPAEGKTITVKVQPFVAARHGIRYKKAHLFEQEDVTTSKGAAHLAPVKERMNRDAWSGLLLTIRTPCDDPLSILAAVTTTTTDEHEFKFEVSKIEHYPCDACLSGTWTLVNDTYSEAILKMVTNEGISLDGSTVRFIGDYFIHLKGDGRAFTWGDDFETRYHFTNPAGNLDISYFMRWVQGLDYSADGKIFTAWNIAVIDFASRTDQEDYKSYTDPNVHISESDGMTVVMDGPSQIITPSGSGSYTCTKTRLTINFDMFDGVPLIYERPAVVPQPPEVVLKG